MKMIIAIFSLSVFLINPAYSLAQESYDLSSYEKLLKKYVQGTKVDFTGLCQDPGLAQSVGVVSNVNPDQLQDSSEKLSFWLNTYNIYTLKVICDRYPIKSMANLSSGLFLAAAVFGKTVWDKPLVTINNRKYTLKEIDHQVIRGNFKDSRIQFSLYCGASSCPALRNEPFKAMELDRQMAEQAKEFFNNPQWNSFDLTTKTARLSPLLNWNAKYFGKDRTEILKFISDFIPDEIGESLRKESQEWKIQYTEYSMILNDSKKP